MVELWNIFFFQPILNGMILLYSILLQNFGLTIIVFTLIVRAATFPLAKRQIETTKKIMALQPKLLELQKRYAKDMEKLRREQVRLYQEAGISPLGCLWPMLIQLPIWIAVFQVVRYSLATTPEELLSLSKHLYDWSIIHRLVPLKEDFLWLDLSQPNFLLALLVGSSFWIYQKMTTLPTTDPRQQSMNNMMLWMMPMMFALLSLQFASGLALYWATFNILSIIIHYFIGGWGGLKPAPLPTKGVADVRVHREECRGSDKTSVKKAGIKEGRGRDSRPTKR